MCFVLGLWFVLRVVGEQSYVLTGGLFLVNFVCALCLGCAEPTAAAISCLSCQTNPEFFMSGSKIILPCLFVRSGP